MSRTTRKNTHAAAPTPEEAEQIAAAVTAPTLTDAQCLGTAPLDSEVGMPSINIDDPIYNRLARNICNELPPYLIFRRDKSRFLTVEQSIDRDHNGLYPVEVEDMSARRLCSYLGDRLRFMHGSGEKAKRVPMSKELAEQILACDEWRKRCPKLELILPVRLPVWTTDENGKRRVTLAKPGYDPDREFYTAETLNYSTEKRFTPAQLVGIWNRIMHSFPWAAEGEPEEKQQWQLDGKTHTGACPSTNRSACCCLALMLGQYCRMLIDDLMPIGVFSANQQGSGKSLLAWLCVAPVWGMAAGTAAPKDDQEAIKSLHSALIGRAPYHMLDDITSLANNTINMIATSNVVTGRLLGGNETFTVRNYMQIFATGNNLATSADVERRSLIVDLFMQTSAIERKFESPMTQKSLARIERRADLLRFMHSMVMNWSDAGCPRHVQGSAKPTFESFAEVIGSIMVHNKFANPFRERQYDGEGGDMLTRTIEKLLREVVTEEMGDIKTHTYTVKELIEFSDARNYTEAIAGNKNPHYSFGNRLRKLRGRVLKDSDGRPFEFGRRKEAGQSSYTFTRLDI